VDETFGGGEGKRKGEARRKFKPGSSVIFNFVIMFLREGGGSITWNFDVDIGASLGRNFDVKIGTVA
jgi:hypothetical protein